MEEDICKKESNSNILGKNLTCNPEGMCRSLPEWKGWAVCLTDIVIGLKY